MAREAWPTAVDGTGSKAEDAPDIGAYAELVVDDFYKAQRQRHGRERQKLERSSSLTSTISDALGKAVGSVFGTGQTAKWNRQELYLDDDKCKRARQASCRHLARHPNWLRGKTRLDATVLRDHVAVQHYVDLDLEDLRLPVGERRSEDNFCGTNGDVCEQLLLDASRSIFNIEGEVFDFATTMAASSLTVEDDPLEVERLKQDFSMRLITAVRRCLGGEPPQLLLRAVSTALSQSGLANVERACESPQVIVGGGEQTVRYELTALGRQAWELKLSVHKHGFEQCIVYSSQPDVTSERLPDPLPLTCGPSSSILKACTMHVSVSAASAENGEGQCDILADVIDLRKEFQLVDSAGRPLPGFGKSGLWSRRLGNYLRTIVEAALRLCGRCFSSCASGCGRVLFLLARPTKRLLNPTRHAKAIKRELNR